MKTALVLGINGTFGKHVAKELQNQGWHLKALLRDPAKISDEFQPLDVIKGNAANIEDVRNASNDVSLIVYGVSPANYQWEGKVTQWLDVSAKVAEEKKLKLIFPGNVYNFNPEDNAMVTESSQQSPVTRKGELRQLMEKRLEQAANNGAKVLIFRMGDFIAHNSGSSWLTHMMSKKNHTVTLRSPGPQDLKHTWAYLPDVAKTISLLADKLDDMPSFNVYHFEGYRASINDIAQAITSNTDNKVVIKPYPWWALYPLRPFMALIKGLFEMRYLWNSELNLDGHKLKQTLSSAVPSTPLNQALQQSYNLR